MPSKYDPLQARLARERAARVRLTFKEIESVVGFPLPESARRYAQWWANVGGSHVQAEAWMGAGWRTCDVDVDGQRVTFKRDVGAETAARSPPAATSTSVEEAGEPFRLDIDQLTELKLSEQASRTLRAYLLDSQGDLRIALSNALDDAAQTRRARLVDWFRVNSPAVPGDSTDLIREDRDAR
jgi:hypothetical protein